MRRTPHTARNERAIAAQAERQHGVVSRHQLRKLGLTDDMIDDAAGVGRLYRIFRGAYAVGHRNVGRSGWMLAAVFACGDRAVVSHGSAAELLGLWDAKPTLVHVIGPNQAGRKIDGIRLHRVSLPGSGEVTRVDGIPCTNAARTLVDLAGSVGTRSLRRLVEQAAVLQRLDIAGVDRALARSRRRGAPQLRAILDDWRSLEGSSVLRSVFEARLLAALLAAGLPHPQCNVTLRIDGRSLEVDLLWREQRVVVEADGKRTHATSAAFQRDRWRDQILASAGYRTARVTWSQLEDEPVAVVNRIARMLKV